MKRILHMTPPEVSNGVYRYIFNHMPFVDQSKYQFCFWTKSKDELMQSEEYKKYHFPVYYIKSVQRDGKEQFIRDIKEVLDEGFDAIHLHTSCWRGFLIEEIAMQMKIPKVIVHSHSSGIDFSDEQLRNTIYQEHVLYKERFTMDYATDVCACSQIAADWLYGSKIPRETIKIMPNAVDASKFRFNVEIRKSVRQRLNIDDRIVIGNVGRYSYTKNQDFLIRVMAQALKSEPRLFLILIGQGENIEIINKMVSDMNLRDNVLCLGWMNNITDYLQAMDLFCLPSKFEGLPISVIEAQAAGLRCLVSEKVTKEVDITGLVDFLPLDEKIWEDVFCNYKSDTVRPYVDDDFEQSGYDIETSSKKLMSLYE